MQTFYHVPSPAYRAGDDLLCWDALQEAGSVTEDDWKHEWDWVSSVDDEGYESERLQPRYVDTALVSLFPNRLCAIATLGSKGFDTRRIVRVDLPDDYRLTTCGDEPWTAAWTSIPAQYLTVEEIDVSDDLLRDANRALDAAFTAMGCYEVAE